MKKDERIEKEIANFIDRQIAIEKTMMEEEGSLLPVFNFLVYWKKQYGDVHVPVPTFLMKEQEGKDFIVGTLLKTIKKEMKDRGLKVICINWASEAWAWTAKKGELENLTDKSLDESPRTEILISTFDTKNSSKMFAFRINRSVSSTKEGLKNIVTLEKLDEELEENTPRMGRFDNFFKDK